MTKNDRLVTIMTFNTELEAEMQRTFFESMGIKSIIDKDDVGGMQPNFQLTGGVRLLVNERDEQKAKLMLKSVMK